MISRIGIQYTAEYIANVFWNQNIAQVSSVTLLPYLFGRSVYQTAYVSIATWCDSEVAYNLIQRLKDNTKKARIIHHIDSSWNVKINNRNSGIMLLGSYTTNFSTSYYEKNEPIKQPYTNKKEENIIQHYEVPFMHMSLKEANERIDHLKQILDNFTTQTNNLISLQDFKNEIEFLQDQVFDITAGRSQNVTLRSHQQPCVF